MTHTTPQPAAELIDAQIEAIARAHGTGGWQTLADMAKFARAILAAATPQPQALPELPAPMHRGPDGTGSYFDSYTAAQMHAYARAALASQPPAPAEAGRGLPDLTQDPWASIDWILKRCPWTVRQREGGGPEDLLSTLIVTFTGMQGRLERDPMFTPRKPPSPQPEPAVSTPPAPPAVVPAEALDVPHEVHIAGPDDVITFASELEAHRHANAVNKTYLADRLKNPDNEVLCVATVEPAPTLSASAGAQSA